MRLTLFVILGWVFLALGILWIVGGFWEVAFLEYKSSGPYWVAVLHDAAAFPLVIAILCGILGLNIAAICFRFPLVAAIKTLFVFVAAAGCFWLTILFMNDDPFTHLATVNTADTTYQVATKHALDPTEAGFPTYLLYACDNLSINCQLRDSVRDAPYPVRDTLPRDAITGLVLDRASHELRVIINGVIQYRQHVPIQFR